MTDGLPRKSGSTPADGRLFHLDVVRGIAILLVLGTHTPAVLRIHPAGSAMA